MSKLLIAKGADINVRNRANESPLYIAASRRRTAMRLLSDQGAQIPQDEQRLFVTLLVTARITTEDAEDMVVEKGAAKVVEKLILVYRP